VVLGAGSNAGSNGDTTIVLRCFIPFIEKIVLRCLAFPSGSHKGDCKSNFDSVSGFHETLTAFSIHSIALINLDIDNT
jgi:hypothetical protein